jgi:uncharacterized protein (DUF1697 family)
MKPFVALLRAVNVGGTGALPMADLRRVCEALGFEAVRTYIASGNVVFRAEGDESDVKAVLESALLAHAGRRIDVMVRTGAAMAAVLAANPFTAAPPNRVAVIFLDVPPPEGLLASVTGRRGERIAAGHREIYVWYDDGQGASRLKIPAAAAGTARNINTVARLVEWSTS